MSNNPMHKAYRAPRCTAKSKRTGRPCRSPAVRGWKVCRMHGARGVFGSVLAIALLGERLQFFHAVGYLLVLAGITLATRR
jgi:hypothetical protein